MHKIVCLWIPTYNKSSHEVMMFLIQLAWAYNLYWSFSKMPALVGILIWPVKMTLSVVLSKNIASFVGILIFYKISQVLLKWVVSRFRLLPRWKTPPGRLVTGARESYLTRRLNTLRPFDINKSDKHGWQIVYKLCTLCGFRCALKVSIRDNLCAGTFVVLGGVNVNLWSCPQEFRCLVFSCMYCWVLIFVLSPFNVLISMYQEIMHR